MKTVIKSRRFGIYKCVCSGKLILSKHSANFRVTHSIDWVIWMHGLGGVHFSCNLDVRNPAGSADKPCKRNSRNA